MSTKILIIRFSSFGDIVFGMGVLSPLREKFPQADIHWLTKKQYANLFALASQPPRVIVFDKAEGLLGLIKLAIELRQENYDYVYDAHSNIRSLIVRLILGFRKSTEFLIRKKYRLKRWLLFSMRVNLFPRPYRAIESYVRPLQKWGVRLKDLRNLKPQLKELKRELPESFIALVPSAAWPMKRWPVDHWKRCIQLLPGEMFVLLGGPEDDFCDSIQAVAPRQVINLAGKLSLEESCQVVFRAKKVVSADTGLLQVADLFGVPCLALMGPTAFGFSTFPQTKTLEVELPCRPCTKDGRGRCSQSVYQRCMVEITPERVAAELSP